ncbi:Hypothetical predicted protein [Mytilus galloprovincialis]|uniref:Uncharacterized protein n=1 Tax=Mytilus galloprovincialis TaxID=29158 RepID=A0A8B6BVY2_MYTGA|nr:Hypothetical predicted protein [Mytilus galloprovincialis]
MYVLMLLVLDIVQGQNLTVAKALYSDLITGYKKQLMPMTNFSEPLSIGLTIYLMSFNSFEEVDETLSVTSVVSLKWIDPSLKWDPAAYGNLTSLALDPVDIWLPPVFLLNGVKKLEPIGGDTKFHVIVDSNGEINYSPGGVLNAKCPTDIAKFPFDEQTCDLQFVPWGLTLQYVILYPEFENIQLQYFTSHSDWKIVDHSTYLLDIGGLGCIWAHMKIKRQPLYYAIMTILPTLLFSLLNPLVFVLPVESGERVSLSITILLSYAIFLTLVSASIPTSSNPMCTLLTVMIAIIAISGIIVFGAIFSVRYYYSSDPKTICCTVKYLVRMKLRLGLKRNVVQSKADVIVEKFSGKDVAHTLDFIFLIITYGLIFVIIFSYFIYVLS